MHFGSLLLKCIFFKPACGKKGYPHGKDGSFTNHAGFMILHLPAPMPPGADVKIIGR
jgi:hypothetical protein